LGKGAGGGKGKSFHLERRRKRVILEGPKIEKLGKRKDYKREKERTIAQAVREGKKREYVDREEKEKTDWERGGT